MLRTETREERIKKLCIDKPELSRLIELGFSTVDEFVFILNREELTISFKKTSL